MPTTANTNASVSTKTLTVNENNDTITGNKTFDRGAATAPFTVAQATAAKVTNLDADKLDGLHASEINADKVDGLNALDWTAFTPTLTNVTLGTGSVSGAYARFGKTVHYYVMITLGVGGSLTGQPTFTLPVTADAAQAVATTQHIGDASLLSAGNIYDGKARVTSDSQARLYQVTGGIAAAVGAAVPAAWANGDRIWITGTYRAAAAV